jgi:hypothetical protein
MARRPTEFRTWTETGCVPTGTAAARGATAQGPGSDSGSGRAGVGRDKAQTQQKHKGEETAAQIPHDRFPNKI